MPASRQRFRRDTSPVARERFCGILCACCAHAEQVREAFTGAVDCDETLFAGSRKGRQGWGAAGKAVVFGICSATARSKPSRSRHAMRRRSLTWCMPLPVSAAATTPMTGRSMRVFAFRGIISSYAKRRADPREGTMSTGSKAFWSYANNWLYPYRGVPRRYVHLYLGVVLYRFNHRKEDLKPLLLKLS